MEEKTQEEKDKEELATRRLQDLISNQSQFNLEILSQFATMKSEIAKLKTGINLILESLEGLLESAESKKKPIPKYSDEILKEELEKQKGSKKIEETEKDEEEDDDEDEDEEDEDEEEDDDLGYSKKKEKRI